MRYDYLELGSVPSNEQCEQVGTPDYDDAMAKQQCQRYRQQLEKTFPIPSNVDCRFTLKSFPHDFGSYREVCIAFADSHDKSIAFAFHVENNLPGEWDDNPVPMPYAVQH